MKQMMKRRKVIRRAMEIRKLMIQIKKNLYMRSIKEIRDHNSRLRSLKRLNLRNRIRRWQTQTKIWERKVKNQIIMILKLWMKRLSKLKGKRNHFWRSTKRIIGLNLRFLILKNNNKINKIKLKKVIKKKKATQKVKKRKMRS